MRVSTILKKDTFWKSACLISKTRLHSQKSAHYIRFKNSNAITADRDLEF